MPRSGQKKRLLVLGPNSFTWRHLQDVPDAADRYEFFPVLEHEAVISKAPPPFDVLLERVEAAIREVGGMDAVVAFWDFPATCLAAVLSERHDWVGPGLLATLKCEHKLWSRQLQREVAPEVVPAFECVDPFDDRALSKLELEFPFWLKPIKSAASTLGFRIANEGDFVRAIARIRKRIHIMGDSFGQAMRYARLPEPIARGGANLCIAEQLVSGEQVTVEGYVQEGIVRFHGIVDSIRLSNQSTFSRYQYPSQLPATTKRTIQDVSRRVMEHIGYDDGVFNIEYFYDAKADQLWLLEINPRISQSHALLFQLVDGAPNFSEMVSVALGEPPPPKPGGYYARAAKLFYRTVLEDATVLAVPSDDEIAAIEQTLPGVEIQRAVEVGQRLSDLAAQDSYSYELALMHIGGNNEGEILQKYQECVDRMTFAFGNMDDVDAADGHHRVRAVPQVMASLPGEGE